MAIRTDSAALRKVIPQELQDRAQWVTWRLEERAGKRVKIPYNPKTGKKAKAADTSTWGSLLDALQALPGSQYAGVGFEFAEDDPYCGLDFDNALGERREVKPWARELLTLLPPEAYVEVSPGGRGLHVIVRGKKPGPRCRAGAGDGTLEIYEHGRFFTVTGDLLSPESRVAVDAQQGLEAIYDRLFGQNHGAAPGSRSQDRRSGPAQQLPDQVLLDRAFASKNGAAIRALWNGDTSRYKSASEADLALCAHLWFWTGGDARRVDALFRQSGLMRAKWDRDDYREATISKAGPGAGALQGGSVAVAGGNDHPQLPAARDGDSARSRTKHRRTKRLPVVPDPSTDLDAQDAPQGYDTHKANAWRIAGRHRRELRFAPELGFLVFDGRRWKPSETGALRIASRVSKHICGEAAEVLRQAAACPEKDQRKALEKKAEKLSAWARTSEQGNAIRESLKLTAPLVEIDPAELDHRPLLLNVENGTLDLEEGKLRPHSAEDLLTKLAPVRYDPKAEAPLWHEFLDRITGSRERLVRYLQKALGYSITGLVREQCFFLAYGRGQNGKTTLLETVRAVLGGDYVAKAAPDLLMLISRGSRHSSDVADLRGTRIAICQEVGPGKAFDSQKLKELTGERWLKARCLYKDWTEFKATFKVWLAANDWPQARDSSLAFWRRLHLIPFTETIATPDRSFPSRLATEKSGILSWLVAGARRYLKEGLEAPPEVTEAVEEYRRESDTLGQFIAECCDTGDGREIRATELWTAYEAYAKERGLPMIRRRDLKMELLNRGFQQPPRRNDGFYYTGVAIRSSV